MATVTFDEKTGVLVTTPGRALRELRGTTEQIAEQVGVLARIVSDPHFPAQLGDTEPAGCRGRRPHAGRSRFLAERARHVGRTSASARRGGHGVSDVPEQFRSEVAVLISDVQQIFPQVEQLIDRFLRLQDEMEAAPWDEARDPMKETLNETTLEANGMSAARAWLSAIRERFERNDLDGVTDEFAA